MNLSKDFKFLVVGSASYNQKELSNIYVIDCKTFEIVKTLSFHTRGVQSIAFSASRKHIVSIGNCKECTIAIWEWPSGKLLTSSYTLDRINDLKISEIVHS
jgi:WD40 repeat protein